MVSAVPTVSGDKVPEASRLLTLFELGTGGNLHKRIGSLVDYIHSDPARAGIVSAAAGGSDTIMHTAPPLPPEPCCLRPPPMIQGFTIAR